MNDLFRKFVHKTSEIVGSSWSFIAAVVVIVIWAAMGPIFHYSDTWQLVINTGTTIITFLMVFLIQNTQNRDARAIHLKLDELIKATKGANNTVIDLDELSDEQLKMLEVEYKRLCKMGDESGNGDLLKAAEQEPRKSTQSQKTKKDDKK